MKREYKKPEVQFIELKKEDVLTTSGTKGQSTIPGDELLNEVVTDEISPIQ